MTMVDNILNILLPDYPTQHIQSNLLHDNRFIPTAAPEEFTVIGSVGRASQSFGQTVNSSPVADPMISICHYNSYRQDRPFLFDVFHGHNFRNRSV